MPQPLQVWAIEFAWSRTCHLRDEKDRDVATALDLPLGARDRRLVDDRRDKDRLEEDHRVDRREDRLAMDHLR